MTMEYTEDGNAIVQDRKRDVMKQEAAYNL